MCHQCQRNYKPRVAYYSKFGKQFCTPCITWYPNLTEEDVKEKCPHCKGYCNCKNCLWEVIPLKKVKLSNEEKIELYKYTLRKILPFEEKSKLSRSSKRSFKSNALHKGSQTSRWSTLTWRQRNKCFGLHSGGENADSARLHLKRDEDLLDQDQGDDLLPGPSHVMNAEVNAKKSNKKFDSK